MLGHSHASKNDENFLTGLVAVVRSVSSFKDCFSESSSDFFPDNFASILPTKYVGCDGPIQSLNTKKTTKDPAEAWMTVMKRINANFEKNVMTQNNMIIAAAIVVNAAAKIDGPILIKACLVRSLRDALPGIAEYAWPKCITKSTEMPINIAKQIDSKKPNVHPNDTNVAVTLHNTYPIVNVENNVNINDRDENNTTADAAPKAIAAEEYAVLSIAPFV